MERFFFHGAEVQKMLPNRKRLLKGAAAGLATLLTIFVVTEYVYYFPLTPLSLDTKGLTRLRPQQDHVRVLFVGDIKLWDTAIPVIRSRGYDYIFAATRRLIQEADLSVGNLEGPMARNLKKARTDERKRWSYMVPPEAAPALQRAGFDLMNLANNHILDCGPIGIRESILHLYEAGIRPFGAGMNAREARTPVIVEAKGIKIAFLGYLPPYMMIRGRKTSLFGLGAGSRRAGSAFGHTTFIRQDILNARRKGADVVLVSIHMGDRYQKGPMDFEQKLCRDVVDAGASAVIGHGTHIMGPVEIYRGRPIFYSLGNFTFGSGNILARFSLMAFLDIDPRSRDVALLNVLPIYTVNRNPWVNHQTKVLTGIQGARVIKQLLSISRPFFGIMKLEKNPVRAKAVLEPEKLSQ